MLTVMGRNPSARRSASVSDYRSGTVFSSGTSHDSTPAHVNPVLASPLACACTLDALARLVESGRDRDGTGGGRDDDPGLSDPQPGWACVRARQAERLPGRDHGTGCAGET